MTGAPDPSPPASTVPAGPGVVPVEERAFYVEEFAGSTLVVALTDPDRATLDSLARASAALRRGRARLVVVVDASPAAPIAGADAPGTSGAPSSGRSIAGLRGVLGSSTPVLTAPPDRFDERWLARLWVAVTDRDAALVDCPDGHALTTAAHLAGTLGALKLVVTDPEGGWGVPPRSFVDIDDPARGFDTDLAPRQGGAVVTAVRTALRGGVTSVNLCTPQQIDEELFTFDGVGSLFTSGDYLRLDALQVDDLPAVEDLVAQGVADGLLRPRSRLEVARLAVTGLGARVQSSGHLAGLVSLETEPYLGHGLGEVACLYTVSRFSGAGAGGLLVDGLVVGAVERGLRGIFAVTVSETAAGFFARQGFAEVGHDDVPAAKWDGYDPARRAAARAFLRPLTHQPRLLA